jgi:hypothetical protein
LFAILVSLKTKKRKLGISSDSSISAAEGEGEAVVFRETYMFRRELKQMGEKVNDDE